MPRKSKKESSNRGGVQNSQNTSKSKQTEVANVNMLVATRSKNDDQDKNGNKRVREHSSSNNKRTRIALPTETADQTVDKTCAEFVEGNKRVNMEASTMVEQTASINDANENELSDEDIVELRHSENDSLDVSMDEHAADLSDQGENAMIDSESAAGSRRVVNRAEMETHELIAQEKIRQIDLEMKDKLMQLHDIMAQGGMQESMEVVNKCTQIINDKQTPIVTYQPVGETTVGEQSGINTNINVVTGNNCAERVVSRPLKTKLLKCQQTKSAETIYDSTVPKRNSSSSSEELGLNTSDEINRCVPLCPEVDNRDMVNKFITDTRRSADQDQFDERDARDYRS